MKKRAAKKRAQSSAAQRGRPFKRGNPYRFPPGTSGNPGGLSAEVRAIKEYLTRGGMDLARVVHDKGKKGNLYAAVKGLEWAIGKPKQEVEVSGKDGGPIAYEDVSGKTLGELERALQAALDESESGTGTGTGGKGKT